jgi:hypothetical protein
VSRDALHAWLSSLHRSAVPSILLMAQTIVSHRFDVRALSIRASNYLNNRVLLFCHSDFNHLIYKPLRGSLPPFSRHLPQNPFGFCLWSTGCIT